MLNRWGQGGGYNAALSLYLPLDDAGAGVVNLVPGSAAGSPTATFTRATTATTILSNGLIGSVASGTARSCYSPAGVYLGYLAEEQRTNLCLQSENLGTTWTNNALNNSLNATTAPDGNATADLLREDSTSAQHFNNQAFTKAASALAYTASVFVKTQSSRNIAVQMDDGTNGTYCVINPSTGAVVTASTNVGTGFTSPSVSVDTMANGWYRIKFTATSTTSTTLNLKTVLCSGSNTNSYAGDNTSGVYVWGAQLEQAAFATSYIPTTTASVTRNADVLSYPWSGNGLGTSGTCYAEVTPQAATGSNKIIVDASASTYALFLDGSNKPTVYDGTTGVGTVAAISANTTSKCATRWDASDSAKRSCANGVTPVTGAFDGDMNLGTSMFIGSDNSPSLYLNGTIKNVRIWTRALSDTELVNLTT